jgi:hypothetical protein
MRKRTWRLLLTGFVVVLLAWVGFLAVRPWVPRHRIDREGVQELRRGMTEAEVERVLGVPAGDYAYPRRRYIFPPTISTYEYIEPLAWKEWAGDEVKVRIGFGPDGTAWSISRSLAVRRTEGALDHIRRLLHLD